jgi:hypothetical protein
MFHLGSIQLDITDSICASFLSNRLNRTMYTDGLCYSYGIGLDLIQ